MHEGVPVLIYFSWTKGEAKNGLNKKNIIFGQLKKFNLPFCVRTDVPDVRVPEKDKAVAVDILTRFRY